MPIIRVALNVPVDTLFDYFFDDAVCRDIGYRACVPFGNKRLTGIILEVNDKTQVPAEKIKPAYGIFREISPLPPALLELFRFCSQYYHHPLGMIILNGLPALLRTTKPVKLKTTASQTFCLTDAGKRADIQSIPARNRVARRLLAAFQANEILANHQIKQLSPRAIHLVPDWQQSGWIKIAPPATAVTVDIPVLTAEQTTAVTAITAGFSEFHSWLLHGVTGSGKTEVYLRIIAAALSQGKQILVLIPEINLTPQLESVFRTRFPTVTLVNLHSGRNDTERMTGWLQAQRGEADIILGTRLAVFTPIPKLGVVIVDEEHDTSYKQQDGLRYSARDLAIFRARQNNIPVVLGSATPSLESYFNATQGRYQYLCLTARAISEAALPAIRYIDTRIHKTTEGFTDPLIIALEKNLTAQRQSLVFINRRGYAPVLLCRSCGWGAHCQRCSSRLVVHQHGNPLRCHYCGHRENFPRACPQCGNQDLTPLGHGTQRIEETLTARFPTARILRIDRDSTRRKHAWQEILQLIHTQQIDILVGTQLLAKGHDFPNLSLVGILNADASLYSTDFRASERLFAQLMQVAGRAGRARIPGEVLIQTEFPDHPLFYALQRHDYDAFAQILLTERKTAGFPPFVYQALFRAEAHDNKTVLEFLDQAKQKAHHTLGIELYDPVPSQMSRLKGMERAHILVQSHSRKNLQAFLSTWLPQISTLANRKIRWSLDVDPADF
ncbi:MAG: primosomal protein N' [Nitrosomonas sp.]|nr:MAG: primosomal protein N' [Nitrosomonas sp.]